MESKSRINRTAIFRSIVIITLIATLYCVVNFRYVTSSPMLCTSRQITYSKGTSESINVAGRSEHKYLQNIQEIFESYQRFHKHQRRNLLAGRPIQTLTWYCVSDCNGIGDRMKGIYAAFLLALAMNRTFFIHLSDQVQDSMLLEPNAIDWRPASRCSILHSDQVLDTFGRPNFIRRKVFKVREDFKLEIDRLKTEENIFISGKALILNLMRTIQLSKIAAQNHPLQELFKVMLQPHANIPLHNFLSALHQYLFHVPQVVEKEVKATMNHLNLQPQKFVSVHIRTGFKNSFLGEIVATKEFLKGNRFPRTKTHWRQMMDCAINIADSELGNDSLILVSSDDQEPKTWAAKEYEPRVRTLDIHPVHVGNKPILGMVNYKSDDKAFLQTWVELSVMSEALGIVSIPSGFAEVAGFMGSINPLFLYFYNISEKKCFKIQRFNWAYKI